MAMDGLIEDGFAEIIVCKLQFMIMQRIHNNTHLQWRYLGVMCLFLGAVQI